MKLKRFLLSAICLLLTVVLFACKPNSVETSEGSESNESQKEVVLFGGTDDYRVVYSGTANNNVKELLTYSINAVKDVTGKAPTYNTDISKSNKEVSKEILLGVTTRNESESALGQMTFLGYDIRFIGEKLVITASSDVLLKKAVEALIDAWNVNGSIISISNQTVITYDATKDMMSLYNNGKFEYKIIIPLKASESLYKDATYLSQSLSAITGEIVDIYYDEKTEENDGAYEICLGRTTRGVSQKLYADLDSVFEYKVITEGNRIAVGSLQDIVISQAVRVLYSDLYSEVIYAYTGTPAIPEGYGTEGVLSEVAAELPMLKAGDFYGIYQSDENKFITYTKNVTKTDYENYVTEIRNDGAELLKEYSFGENKYALLQGDKYSAYVSYLPMESAIRTFVGESDIAYYLESETIEANVATPTLWQLEVDTKGSGSNGGMSYVIRLTDGSFIVIDGGYNTEKEADDLYNLLKDNTPDGEIPTISGWFITHLHTDHYGAMLSFANKYSSSTNVKAFYYNFPGVAVASSSNPIDTSATKSIVRAMKSWKNVQCYGTLHSGMKLGFAGATAEIICTHEDVYPLTFTDGNDTCTVIKLSVGGQKIMFAADARDSQSVTMLNTIPKDTLKSDIVQFSHHGYEGCSADFYKLVGAGTVLWPMNIIGKENGQVKPIFKNWYNNSMAANKYVRTSPTVKKIIVSGAGTQKLELPYTPTGDRIADYEAIYNERLSNY